MRGLFMEIQTLRKAVPANASNWYFIRGPEDNAWYRQFLERLQQMVLRYDKYGYNYAKHVFNDVKN